MEFRGFDAIKQLQPYSTTEQPIYLNFDGKPESIKFTIKYILLPRFLKFVSFDQYSFPVVLHPSIGELVFPSTLSIAEFNQFQSILM